MPTLVPTKWTLDKFENIHFTLTSNGMTREEWRDHLRSHHVAFSDMAHNVLHQANEPPTDGMAYHIVVRPSIKFGSKHCNTKNIRADATQKRWQKPHWEVACLICSMFPYEFMYKQFGEMGLWWLVIMHKPIVDPYGDPYLFEFHRKYGNPYLDVHSGRPYSDYDYKGGFAFVVPERSR